MHNHDHVHISHLTFRALTKPKQMSSDSSMRVQFTPNDSSTEWTAIAEVKLQHRITILRMNQTRLFVISSKFWPSYCLCKFIDRIRRCLLLPFSTEQTRTQKHRPKSQFDHQRENMLGIV